MKKTTLARSALHHQVFKVIFFMTFAIVHIVVTSFQVLANEVTINKVDGNFINNISHSSLLFVLAEKIKVNGKINDNSGKPLSGVSIKIRGTATGTLTNSNGLFTIDAEKGAFLEISYMGFISQVVSLNEMNSINNVIDLSIVLSPDSKEIDQVVVIGYGTQKRKDLTGSISRLTESDIQNKAVNNPLELLRGTVAGFTSNMSTSAKGGGSMQIRGQKSLLASNEPLLVVDGVIYNGVLDDINPTDIESIDLLKDGSAAAVYGSRAAAGVISITTKKGKSEKPLISFDVKSGITDLLRLQPVYSPEEYIIFKGDAHRSMNGFTKPAYYYRDPRSLPDGVDLTTWLGGQTGDPLDIWLTGRLQMNPIEKSNFLDGKSFDWMSDAFQRGVRHDHTVSVSGRSNKSSYYWSIGSINNDGIIVGDQYKTIRSRLNFTTDITDFLQIGINSQFADRNDGTNPVSIASAVTASPYGSKFELDGTYKWFPHDDNLSANPYRNYEAKVLNNTQTLIANLFANIKLPFGIKYQLVYNNRYAWQKNYQFFSSETFIGRAQPTAVPGINLSGVASRNEGSSYSWQLDNIFTWNKTFSNQHRIDLTALINAEKNMGWNGTVSAAQFSPSDALGFNNLGVGVQTRLTTTNNDTYSTGDAMMFRVNYAYKDKYLLTGSVRRDGFSAFGLKNPRAFFPAVAFAWRISDENFMKSGGLVHSLKLRMSYGINGNRSIPIYGALAAVSSSPVIINGQSAIAITNTTLANENLRWERTSAYNVGLDFGLFKNNRVSGTIEGYLSSTQDLLLNRSLPSIIGYRSVLDNLGEVTNRGVELTLRSLNVEKRNFQWNSDLVFSLNRNQIKHLYGNLMDIKDADGKVLGQREADDITNGWFIGHAIDQIFSTRVLGVWQESESVAAALYGRRPGDIKLEDIANATGRTEITDIDRVFQQFRQPRFRLGLRNSFTIKENLLISFFLRSDLGHYGVNDNFVHTQNPYYNERLNTYKYAYWTPENPTNEGARLNSGFNPRPSVFKNSSFVRLQDFTVSYTIKKEFLSRFRLQSARVFANVNNALTFTNWDFWDPETYQPTPRIFTVGLNFSL